MSFANTHLKELDEYRLQAAHLVQQQQELLGQLAHVASEAGKHAAGAVRDAAGDSRVQAAVHRLRHAEVPRVAKRRIGFGSAIAITIGLVAVAGVAYAVWQTFRATDELWVADEEVVESPEQ